MSGSRALGALLALGLALASAPLAQAEVAPPSTAPDRPAPLTGPVSGKIAGSVGGGFNFFQFSYPGDGSSVVLMLSFDPSDPGVAPGVGISVYQDGLLMAQILGGNYCNDTTSVVFTSGSRSPALVQVVNYIPNVTISYTLTPIGLPGGNAPIATAPPVKGNTTAQTAAKLGKSASGSIQGNSGGSFNYFTLTPPGAGATVTVLMWFFPFDPSTSSGVGFNVFQDGVRIAGASGATAACTRNAQVSFTAPSASPLLIQVYNYTPKGAIAYLLTQP